MVTSRDRRYDLTDTSLDDGSPRNQGEPHTVVQHRESTACQNHGSPEDTRNGLAVGDRVIYEPGPGLNLFCGARQFARSQRLKKVSCECKLLSATLSQAFSDEESLPVGKRRTDLGAESHRRQVVASIHQQSIQPSRAAGTHLALDGDVGSDLHLNASGTPGVINSPLLDKVLGHAPNALLQTLDDASTTQRFQSPYVSLDECFRISSRPSTGSRFREVLESSVDAIARQLRDCAVRCTRLRAIAHGDYGADPESAEIYARWHGDVVGTTVDAVHDYVSTVVQRIDEAFADHAAGDGFGKLGIVEGGKLAALTAERALHAANDVAPLTHRPQEPLEIW